MKTLLQKFNFTFLFILFLSFIIYFPVNKASADSCSVTGPSLVSTNIHVTYKTNIINSNWEVYSYNGAQGQIVSNDFDSLIIDTGPTPGNITVYVLSNPQNLVLCSLNVSVDATLPVELNSFTSLVNGRNVTLSWTTNSEQNNSGFQVERSTVTDIWYNIGFVSGSGNLNTPVSYAYEDSNLKSGRYKYRLKQIDYNGNYINFDLQNEVIVGNPEKFTLHQNYPNPFNPTTQINYDVAVSQQVKISVFDMLGKEISSLVNEIKPPGFYSVSFDGEGLPGGIYFCKLESGKFMSVRKMMLLK